MIASFKNVSRVEWPRSFQVLCDLNLRTNKAYFHRQATYMAFPVVENYIPDCAGLHLIGFEIPCT